MVRLCCEICAVKDACMLMQVRLWLAGFVCGLLLVAVVPNAAGQDLRVMSFNVRYGTAGDGAD